jgi:hypothetical protein
MNHSQGGERTRDALVAVVRQDVDLERFRSELWYRIPERVLGHAIAANTFEQTGILALYQSSSITTGLPGGIELWGEIDRVEKRSRREILPAEQEHPAAEEEYRLVRVRTVERLDRPIISRRRRRFSFLRTTRARLFAAEDINDLIVGSRVEEKLWESLKDLGAERRCFIEAGNAVMEVDFALFNGERQLGLLCRERSATPELAEQEEGWSILQFSAAELDTAFDECLRRILVIAETLRDDRSAKSSDTIGIGPG